MVLRAVNGHLLNVGGHLVANDDCCCGGIGDPGCPSDEWSDANCDSSYSWTLSSISGCEGASGGSGIAYRSSSNVWYEIAGEDYPWYIAYITCNAGNWNVSIEYHSSSGNWVICSGQIQAYQHSCPVGTYTIEVTSSMLGGVPNLCNGLTGTVVIS